MGMSTVPAAMRVIRGTAVCLAVVVVAALGHVVGGGAMHLQSSAFLVLALLAWVGAVALSRREWTLPRLLIVLGAAQVALHVALSTEGRHVTMLADGHPMAVDTMSAAPAMPDMAVSVVDQPGASGSLMLLAHVLAVVVTALLLRRGESVAARVVAVLRAALRPPFTAPRHLVPVLACPVRWASEPLGLREQLLAFSLARRGPPRDDDLAVVA
jgi:hypothetical protein